MLFVQDIRGLEFKEEKDRILHLRERYDIYKLYIIMSHDVSHVFSNFVIMMFSCMPSTFVSTFFRSVFEIPVGCFCFSNFVFKGLPIPSMYVIFTCI